MLTTELLFKKQQQLKAFIKVGKSLFLGIQTGQKILTCWWQEAKDVNWWISFNMEEGPLKEVLLHTQIVHFSVNGGAWSQALLDFKRWGEFDARGWNTFDDLSEAQRISFISPNAHSVDPVLKIHTTLNQRHIGSVWPAERNYRKTNFKKRT